MGGYIARIGEKKGAHRSLLRKPEGKRTLGRRRRKWDDNIKMDLQEVGSGSWTGLIWLKTRTRGGFQ